MHMMTMTKTRMQLTICPIHQLTLPCIYQQLWALIHRWLDMFLCPAFKKLLVIMLRDFFTLLNKNFYLPKTFQSCICYTWRRRDMKEFFSSFSYSSSSRSANWLMSVSEYCRITSSSSMRDSLSSATLMFFNSVNGIWHYYGNP